MQGVGEDAATPSEPSRPRPDGLNPYIAGAIVLALIAGAGLVFWLTQPDADPITPGSQTIPKSEPNQPVPAEPLTKAEAIETFGELTSTLRQAIRNRDSSALEGVVLAGSPLAKRADQEIAELLDKNVRDRSKYQLLRLILRSSTADRVTIREVAVIQPCFIDGRGSDVTAARASVRQTADWSLVRAGGEWLLRDARVMRREDTGRTHSCG